MPGKGEGGRMGGWEDGIGWSMVTTEAQASKSRTNAGRRKEAEEKERTVYCRPSSSFDEGI